MGSLETGDSLSDLCSDTYDLEHWSNQKAHEEVIREEAAQRELAGDDLMRAHVHDHRTHNAHQQSRGQAHQRGCR